MGHLEKQLHVMGTYVNSYPHYELNITATTQFSTLKDFSFLFVLNLEEDFNVFTSSDVNNKNILFISAAVEGSSMNVDIKTPFQHIKLNVTLDYTVIANDSRKYNIGGTWEWGETQKTLRGEFIHQKNGLQFNLEVTPDPLEPLEGSYLSVDHATPSHISGPMNNEVIVNTSLAISSDPGFVHFSVGSGQDNQLVDIRGDLEDLFSARFYVQPQIFTYVMTYLYSY